MQTENIFKTAVEHLGVENQLLKLVEEMAELTQAIIKRRLYPNDPKYFDNLIEEFVDVNLVMMQLLESELLNSEKANELRVLHTTEKYNRLESLLKTQNKTKDKI